MKNILFFFGIACCLCLFSCKAQTKGNPSVSAEKKTITIRSFRDSLPSPRGHVSDFENILTEEQRLELDGLLDDFENKTSVQIALVTIDTSATSADGFDDLALHIHQSWGVGIKGKNNGIVVAVSAGLHRIRISNGEGISRFLSDAETKKIVDESFLPGFKKGNYYSGISEGLTALIRKLQMINVH